MTPGVHIDKKAASEKADDLVRAAVRRVFFHKALETSRAAIHPDVLVVGGGIAGIHTALTLANAGKKVYLVEREATIGGHMAQFDKTFPTLDCAACILTPKMTAVKSHPNITLWTYSDVVQVDGYVGSYHVKVTRHPRYVHEDLCAGCMQCIEACVFKQPKFEDEFNLGLGKRKPIYIPSPRPFPKWLCSIPNSAFNSNREKCKKTCVEACGERNAIDFQQKEEVKEIEVGTIVVPPVSRLSIPGASRITDMGCTPTFTPPWRSSACKRIGPDWRRCHPARRPAAEERGHHPLRWFQG